jgi:hypothetical protein
MDAFGPADYEHICGNDLGPLDYTRIHRFAPSLNAHQLRKTCAWLRFQAGLDTERCIDYLQRQNLTSNVEIQEVSLRLD